MEAKEEETNPKAAPAVFQGQSVLNISSSRIKPHQHVTVLLFIYFSLKVTLGSENKNIAT